MKKTNKNYQRLSIFFLMILGMFIVSCKNPLNLKHNSKDAKKAYIRISTNLSDSKVRSALPESFYDSEKKDTKSGLIWELSGEELNGSDYEKIWEDDSTTNNIAYKQMLGDTSIELDVGTWTFTLTAYVKNSDDIQEKVLESTIQKTIVSGQNSLSFEMEEAVGDEGVANGEISFTLNFPQNQIDNLAITLYKYPAQDGKYIPLGNQATQEIEDEVSSYTCEYSNIEPGNYLLEFALQQETGLDLENNLPSYTTINTYTCVIHVAPGLKSVGSFNLSNLAKLYHISYKYSDGDQVVDAKFDETVTTSYNKYQTFDLPTPTRDGYTFKGWYTDEGTKVTSYKIPDDFNGTEIVFYAAWEEVYITSFSDNIVKESSDGIILETINSSDNTSYGKITNSNYSNEEDIWNKYLRLNDGSFQTGANYSVSIALKAEDTTVVAISAARADMYFTVTDEWQEYTFETGFIETDLVENVNAISMGVAKSETLFIANIKITKIIDGNGNSVDNGLPTLSFNLANSAIDYYLQNHPKDENNCLKPIICVEKDSIKCGYKVTINTKENDSNSNNDSINLTLRDYAIPGINMASFVLDSTCKSSIQGYPVTNLDGNGNPTKNETKSLSENINIWSNSSEKDNENYQYVVIPVPKTGENNSVPCSIEGFVKEVSEENSEITIEIKDYSVIKEINSLENTDKKFAVRVGYEWTKYSDFSEPIDITSPNGTELQVVLTDNNWDTWDWNTNDYYCQFKTYNKVDDDGGLTVEPKNGDSCTVSGAEKIKLSLTDGFTVLIEEVTDTNNDQPAGGEEGSVESGTESNVSEKNSGLQYVSKNDIESIMIHSAEGLKIFSQMINGTLENDIVFTYESGYPAKTFSKNTVHYLNGYLQADIEVSDWIPIGTADHPFTSSFDGQGHSITINSVADGDYAGVFGYAGNYAEPNSIVNLAVKGVLSSANAKYVGGIVACSNGIKVENCINMASLGSGTYVGGIIGYVNEYTTNEVSKCINAGEIIRASSTSHYRGGIVAHTAGNITISDCINLVELSSDGTGKGSGIVDVENTKYNPNATVNNCINVGFVNFDVKIAIANKTNTTTIENCYYDSDKWTRVVFDTTNTYTPTDTSSIGKSTSELCKLTKTELSENWSCVTDETRYPLPNLSSVFTDNTIWQEICYAAKVEVSSGGGEEEIIQNAYYVSAIGSDANDGKTTDTSFATLEHALSKITDEYRTIYIVGTYYGQNEAYNSATWIDTSVGTQESPIQIIGYPDSNPELSQNGEKRVLYISEDSYLILKNISIVGGNTSQSGAAIYFYANGQLTLENCTLSGNESTSGISGFDSLYHNGITLSGNSSLIVKNSVIENNIVLDSASDDSTSVTFTGSSEIKGNVILNSDSTNIILENDITVSGTICIATGIIPGPAITITSALTKHSSDNKISVSYQDFTEALSTKCISLGEGVSSDEISKFMLTDESYVISTDGKISTNN